MIGRTLAHYHITAAIGAGLLPIPGKRALTLMARPLLPFDHDLSWKRWDLSFGDLELL